MILQQSRPNDTVHTAKVMAMVNRYLVEEAKLSKTTGNCRYRIVSRGDIVFVTMERMMSMCELRRWNTNTYLLSRFWYLSKNRVYHVHLYKHMLSPQAEEVYYKYIRIRGHAHNSLETQMMDSMKAVIKMKINTANKLIFFHTYLSPLFLATDTRVIDLALMGATIPEEVSKAINILAENEDLYTVAINARLAAEKKLLGGKN